MFHEFGQMYTSLLRIVFHPGDDALVNFLFARNGDRVAGYQSGHLKTMLDDYFVC